MRTKKLLLSLLIAAGTALPLAAGQARADVNVGIAFGPSAQAFPVAHRGHWAWNGYRYVWVEARQFARPGFAWVPGHWEGRGRYRHFVEGHYVREPRFHRGNDGFDGRDGFRRNDGFYRNW